MFGAGAAEKFNQLITQKTGLVAQGDRFVGQFQGLNAWAKMGPVADVVGAFSGHGGALGGLGAIMGGTGGGMASMMTGGAFFMKHDYVIEMPGFNLPGASLRTPSGFLSDKTHQMRGPCGQRVSSGVQWIDQKFEVCAMDPGFAAYICSSPELQQMLQRWPAPLNLSLHGQEVWLEILDSNTRINSWFNGTQQSNGDMVLSGMYVVAAAARATFSR